jgi:formate dehydrogenase subunit gamma
VITSAPRNTSPAAVSAWIGRFTPTERLLHWSNAVCFLALAFTGFSLHLGPLRHAWSRVLAPLPPLFGQPVTLIDVHIIVAIFFVMGPLLWIVTGDRRVLRDDARDMLHFDADDRAWLLRLADPSSGQALPPQGRFNAGQKLNAIATVLAFLGFVVTGLVISFWPSSAIGSVLPGRPPYMLWHAALILHNLLGLGSLALLAGHIYLAALNPATRHSLQGMMFGRVRRDWAHEHHAKWVAALEERDRFLTAGRE